MAKRSSIEQYQAKLAEAQQMARGVSKEMRSRAKELVQELSTIGAAYEQLTGEPLPELDGIAAARTARGRKRSAGAARGGPRGRRSSLKGAYAGKTLPEAILSAIGRSKSGLGPKEIAEKIGGNRNSISVAMNGMVKEGQIKRAERGKYIAA